LFGVRIDPYFRYKIGGYREKFHSGVDITVDGRLANKKIYAVSDGYVKKARWLGGLGNAIVLIHTNANTNIQPISTVYGHLARILVRPGQRVTNQQVIGIMGSTGNSTGLHLHFEIRAKVSKDKWVLLNPQKLF